MVLREGVALPAKQRRVRYRKGAHRRSSGMTSSTVALNARPNVKAAAELTLHQATKRIESPRRGTSEMIWRNARPAAITSARQLANASAEAIVTKFSISSHGRALCWLMPPEQADETSFKLTSRCSSQMSGVANSAVQMMARCTRVGARAEGEVGEVIIDRAAGG
jgi:hypothetical protein